ncbi:MAG TPA: Asp-tRNA(Asn)/Glu-tRNA(Gln) amidotransferase subunit GatA [Ignisphaera sp.]|uniref:Glutamyl-tRNA(Gln) amidotransferase subunit A n=1 Tax=Ignisphaera aggregans TaxID=334771 RepID=A0A832YZC6_9CREN|nr:Asp-tRNA(Asn)/Glu-tRNA(Gln) amidotransferase subunit GatA [Ignisphaera sp.]HIP57297.1 Asp-tRNA(Asn)/Glu-tRNA(Gln) amidotransferase subunit GatA [Ignisphaera aggregans]
MSHKYISTPAYQLVEEFRSDPQKIHDYVDAIYDRIERVEPKVRAYITIRSRDEVHKDVDMLIKSGNYEGPLFGILVAVKDNISTRGIRTTCASKMLENYVPPYDATVIRRLKSAGAIVLGKTNMDEFAMGSTTETSAFYPTRNPWDLSRVPGGSSGGSAAALVAGEATLALGSDTGGSIRNPAAFTATFGLKPTYGLVSRYGLIAYASSMDQIGPLARNTRDLALLLSVIAGYDEHDATSLPVVVPNFVKLLDEYVHREQRLRIAIVKELFERSDISVQSVAGKALDRLCSIHECDEIELRYTKHIVAAYYIIAMAEASSNLARYDGIRYGLKVEVENRSWIDVYTEVRTRGFGYEVKKRIALGAFVLSAGYRDMYYIKALRFRRMLKEMFNEIFKRFDLVASPTMPILPPKLGELVADPIKMYLADINTVIANLIGIPAISVPVGFYNGLPVGLQFMAPPLAEDKLLYVSQQLEDMLKLRDLIAEVS